MANYSLVANSQFKARSFDDLIRPYLMYTQEYRAQEDALSELATKADVWQGLANEQTDPIAYAQYSNYANALKDQAKVLADRGLNPTTRQSVLNLKRRYSSEIVPIEQAYTTRKAQEDEQRKALLQNPTLLLSRRAGATSLDRYLENQQLSYDSYSGALLTQQVGQAAAAIAKELKDYGNGKRLDQFTKTWLQQHGFTASEVSFAINHPDDPRSSKVLNTLANNAVADSGVANWGDNATINQAYQYARQGLWQAVGQTQVTPYADEAAKLAAQEAMQRRAEARAAAREASKNDIDGEAPRDFSVIEGNGKLSAYTTLHNKLTVQGKGLRSSYFGHKYTNPLKVYDEAVAAMNKAEQAIKKQYADQIRKERNKASYEVGYGGSKQKLEKLEAQQKAAIAKAREQAKKPILSKYGVSNLLTNSEAADLRQLGYNSKSTYNDFRNSYNSKVDALGKQYSYGSVNLSNLDVSNNWISAELQTRDRNKTLAASLWEFNADGTRGSAVTNLDDIDFTKDKLTDVYYGRQNPDYIVVQLGTKRYLADPSLLSSQVRGVIDRSRSLLKMSDKEIQQMAANDPVYSSVAVDDIRDDIARSATAQLRNLLRSYNKTRSNTDSGL